MQIFIFNSIINISYVGEIGMNSTVNINKNDENKKLESETCNT